MLAQNYLSPSELLTRYPRAKEFGWTLEEIDFFIESGFLDVITKNKDQFAFLICEDSFIQLMGYTITIRKINNGEIIKQQ